MARFFVTILLFISVISISAKDYNQSFYRLYIKGEMVEWQKLLKRAENDWENSKDKGLLETIVRAKYGLAVYFMGSGDDDGALKEIKTVQPYLENLKDAFPDQGWVLALDASFKSFKLIINPYRFFMSGPSVLRAINKSKALSPGHADVQFLVANQTFYLPGFLGGDQKEGLRLYNELTQNLLKTEIKKENNWFHLLYLTSHGIACGHAGNYVEATRIYNTILAIEPEYGWVRNELVPQAQKKLDNQYLKGKKESTQKKL